MMINENDDDVRLILRAVNDKQHNDMRVCVIDGYVVMMIMMIMMSLMCVTGFIKKG